MNARSATSARLSQARDASPCWERCSALLAITLPELGSDPWPFRTAAPEPAGRAGPARARGGRGVGRGHRPLGVLPGRAGPGRWWPRWALRRRDWPAWVGTALAVGVALALLLPSTLLQVGLRDATDPWFHTNDSTYQIEIAGDLLLDGDNPYGHDYQGSGMERFYTYDGSVSQRVREREVCARALRLLPRDGRDRRRRGGWCRRRSTTTACSCCS